MLAEHEIVVLGGGPAGIAAAAAAARAGCSTLLVERYGFLGGMGTAAGVTNFCGLHANVHGEVRQVVHGVADELLERIDRLGGLSEPHSLFRGKIKAQAYDNAAYKLAADDLVLASGAKLLFHACAAGFRENHLLVETKSGRGAVRGKLFIDCSGDGDLAAWAGAPFEKGDGRGGMLYPSLMFRVNNVDARRAGRLWERIGELMAASGRRFPRKGAIVRPQKHDIEWRVNVTQLANPDGSAVDGTDAAQLSRAEIEGRRQAADFFSFLRTAPGFENAYLLDLAPQVGIRETRRITGEYQLTDADVLGCASFEDTIGVNGWPIEEHVAGDVRWRLPPIPQSRGFNHLPYRMLLPLGVENLLVAGRCASMTHLGQSAARVSGACFAMGEAAGTAAALALRAGCGPREVDIAQLQAALERNGAYLGKTW
ncbi:MAG TPA: FAD-dependent oxidoreductase [Burkholderiales bacterium]|nr:FAD-dependent oxidoreductase [Burkholderiales bacterium]